MDEMQEKFSADADNAMATGLSPITGIQALQARDIDTSASAVSRADRIRNLVETPDFEIPEYEPLDSVVKNYHMTIDPDVARDMVQRAGIHRSAGAQTAVAIENALMDLGGLGDQMDIAFGNIENYVSGGTVGKDLQDIAYKSIDMRMADMSRNADSVGGIESFMAKLAAGGLSMVELALVSAATYGAGGLAQMGVQAMGEGTYNDMKAYADKHDGSIEGYVPEGADIALNFANALLQAGIEAKFGVASPRFLHGASRGLVKEGLSGALQESSQSLVSDINEVLKGNQEWQSIVENAHGYIEDAVIGGLLQGTLGAATHYNAHAKAVNDFSNVFAWARGRKTPNKQDIKDATSYVNAKENEDAVAMTEEFKRVFDEQTGTGALYKKTLKALNEAVAKHEDWADLDETQKAQRLMQIAQQETLHALRDSMEKGKSIESHAMNEITYKDGAIWIEGLEPEIGDKAVAFSRILAERQSGLNEIQAQIDGLNQEIKQTKQELAEAKKASKDALAEKLQAQVAKQEARAQKRKAEAEKIREQIAKMERQSAKRQAKTRVDNALKKSEKSVAKKSLKAEREAEKKTEEQLTLFQSDMEKQAEPNRLLQEQRSLADENARLDDIYPAYTGDTIRIIDPEELKQAQYEVIQRTNPMQDEYHVGIRSVNDIKTFDETIDDKESFVWGDYSREDAQRDLAKNEITVYSSYPIENGVFVSTSYRQAQEYAGGKGAKVYEKTVPLDYVAWISGDEGQFAITDVVGKKRSVYNSNGERIAQSEPALRNFYKWFGNSKVVDSQGRPLVVYHQTSEIFNTFERGRDKAGKYDYETPGGFFFKSSDRNIGIAGNIQMPVYLKAEKTITFDNRQQLQKYWSENIDGYADLLKQYHNVDTDYNARVDNIESDMDKAIDDLENSESYKNATDAQQYQMRSDLMDSFDSTALFDEWKNAANKIAEQMKQLVNDYVSANNIEMVKLENDSGAIGKKTTDSFIVFEPNQIKSVNNRGTFSKDTGNVYHQGSVKGEGDTYRGGFDEKLKRIVLGEKSDLSTIQHEFAHYWVQNNFKWARSGLATADWLDKWRKVEDWLGIRPDDRFLSREASERFAKAYERFVMDGREVPELAWAYQGFSDFYNEIYEDELKAEYFDLETELSQDVVDWFNAIRDTEPVKRAQVAIGRIGRELARRGNKIVDKGADGTITVSESDGQGGVQTSVFVPQEKAEESKYFESSGKETESGISKTMRDVFGEEVAPQQYVKMDKDATVANADVQVKADRQTAIDKMLDEKTDAIDRAALYNALVKDAVDNNDASALMALSGKEMSDFGTKLGQAVALLDVDSETGFDVAKVARAVSEAKGEMTTEQLDQALKEIDLDSVELTESDATALENEIECQL